MDTCGGAVRPTESDVDVLELVRQRTDTETSEGYMADLKAASAGRLEAPEIVRWRTDASTTLDICSGAVWAAESSVDVLELVRQRTAT